MIEELEGGLWAAALEKNRLEGLEIDPAAEEVRWGSVYWAKVKTIDAALDAAFLDLDGDNTGILYNAEVRIRGKDGKVKKGGDKAIGKILKSGQMIAVQAKAAYIPKSDPDAACRENKIPQMSMDITLPGRYLIFCAMMDSSRISQRIKDKKLRGDIQKMLNRIIDGEGFIVRAAAADIQTEILMREGKILKAAWSDMSKHFAGPAPGLIMLGPDAMQRILGDNASGQIDRIEVVTMEHFNHVEEWCSLFAPDLVTKIRPLEMKNATEDLALFHYRDIMGQIEELFRAYVILSGGGNVIIQTMAALTAVDVNKGGARGSNLSVNLEAAAEIARQLRLRNIGGIVMTDFLKFQSRAEEKKILAALESAFRNDPCTVQIHGRTKLGLVEISRRRRTPSLPERFEGSVI